MLLAQCLRQPLHSLLALALPRLAAGHAHRLHHLLKLAQRLFGLCHSALRHQLLNTVHHILQVLLGELHGLALCHALPLLRLLLCKLLHIVLRRLAQRLHQLGNLLL